MFPPPKPALSCSVQLLTEYTVVPTCNCFGIPMFLEVIHRPLCTLITAISKPFY